MAQMREYETEASASTKTPYTRAARRTQIAGRVLIHNEERLYAAPLINISQGGLFIGQLVNIPEGSAVRVVVKSPRLSAPIQAVGTVVRLERGQQIGLAVKFTKITEETKEIIHNCVSEISIEAALRVA